MVASSTRAHTPPNESSVCVCVSMCVCVCVCVRVDHTDRRLFHESANKWKCRSTKEKKTKLNKATCEQGEGGEGPNVEREKEQRSLVRGAKRET